MGKMDSFLLRSKFRGSMLGALMGDCLGSAYEGEELFTAGMKLVIQRSFDKLEGPHFKAPVIQFTDDSAMTCAIAESLIEHTGFDQKAMAKKFVKSYYKQPNRGYGAGVTTVFQKLRNNKFIDVLGPAREQFNGEGSLGNGGAMRVAPVALFCYKNYELMVDVARKQSQITHTHKTGVDGAILQAIAIHQSLMLDPKEKLDTCKFTEDLIEKMDNIEVDEEGLDLVNPTPYRTQLKLVKDLICEEGDGPHDIKVVHHLGTDISALHSVPTAIYCFLRAQKPIKDIQTENPLRRTVQYAHEMSVYKDIRFLPNPNHCHDIKWSDKETCKLVYWYRKFPCLWKRDISAYTDNVVRHCAYRSIYEAVQVPNVTFTDVMMKIRETRQLYVNELKIALIAQSAGYVYRPKSNWFNVMHEFLYPYLDSNEYAELHKIDCNQVQINYSDFNNVSQSTVQNNTTSTDAENPICEEYCSDCGELHTKYSFCSVLIEQCHPADECSPRNYQKPNRSFFDNSNARCEYTVVAPPQAKDRSSPSLRLRVPRNMHSMQLPDNWSTNVATNSLKAGVQFILSNVSVLSEKSSSTIVCGKKSDYACAPVKSVTDCGVQWNCSDSEQSSPVSCDTSSLGKETRNSATSVEYDEHHIFSKNIACYLRAMDIETALQVKNQILRIITDHRLHKPETQSIRLLRPKINDRGIVRRSPSRIEKSYNVVSTKTRTIERTHLPRPSCEIPAIIPPNKNPRSNNALSSKSRKLQSKIKKPPHIIEPIITHYKRGAPDSTSVNPSTTDKSISLGGDTDTIGSMAGAIAGAFYGEDIIKPEILKHCEFSSEFRDLANQLFDIASA